MRITIKDIAKDTNLSLATISKYINGKNVLPENRILIEASIKKLGYTPNKTAQNLRSKKTNTICIFLPKIGDYFLGNLCSFIEEYMRQINYSTIIASYDPHLSSSSSDLQFILNKQIDGAILVPDSSKIADLPAMLQYENIPFVCLDQSIQGIATDLVTSNNRSGAYNATKYLINSGHHTLGIINGDPAVYSYAERLAGFLDACHEYNISKENYFIYSSNSNSQDSAKHFSNMMKQTSAPTAILICSYDMTLGAILALNDLGLQIPRDFSLISFDDDQIFTAFEPPITTITQNLTEIARQASNLLIKRIKGNMDSFPESRMVETNLIIRKSVAALKFE